MSNHEKVKSMLIRELNNMNRLSIRTYNWTEKQWAQRRISELRQELSRL